MMSERRQLIEFSGGQVIDPVNSYGAKYVKCVIGEKVVYKFFVHEVQVPDRILGPGGVTHFRSVLRRRV